MNTNESAIHETNKNDAAVPENKQDRHGLAEIADELSAMLEPLSLLGREVEEMQSEESAVFDEMSERAQESKKGQKLQELINELEAVFSSIDEAHVAVENAVETLRGLAGA